MPAEERDKPGETNVQVAAEPVVETPPVEGEATPVAEPEPAQPKTVPLEALEAERHKRQQLEQMLLMRPQPQAQPEPNVLAQMGLSPEDVYDPDKLAVGVQGLIQRQVQGAVAQIGQQQFLSQHPDYAQVVGQSYGQQFVPSAQYQTACRDDPVLQQAVQGLIASGNVLGAMQLAYDRACNVKEAAPPQPIPNVPAGPQGNPDVEARLAPMSPASVGGAGGAFATAQKVADLSEQEYAEMDERARGTPG